MQISEPKLIKLEITQSDEEVAAELLKEFEEIENQVNKRIAELGYQDNECILLKYELKEIARKLIISFKGIRKPSKVYQAYRYNHLGKYVRVKL